MKNFLHVISPYYSEGIWAFDDPQVGLHREPFVCGIPEVIEKLTADIPNAKTGFNLFFSAKQFPGYQHKAIWIEEEMDGSWYSIEGLEMKGWLCPALFEYFDSAPKELYFKVEELKA